MPDQFKTEANLIKGCQNKVHIVARKKPGTADVLEFAADADAFIVKGLVVLLQRLYSGQKAGDILAFDLEEFLPRLGLDNSFVLQRRIGLKAMEQRIRALAATLATPQTAAAE
jgi:cysteine desulfurase/selenocysteine lyase